MRHVDEGHDPLSEPVLLILISLSEAPRHGYALIRDIEAISGGRVRLSTGTLFGALKRLLESGWIERFAMKDTSRDKQSYRLTPLGRGHLAADVERLKLLTRAATVRLKIKEA